MKGKISKIRLLHWGMLTILIIAVFLIGYSISQGNSARVREMFFSNVDCIAPCWQSLKPGESSEDDFWEWYNSDENADYDSVRAVDDLANGYHIAIQRSGSIRKSVIVFWFEGEIIHTIHFWGDLPEIQIETLLTELGQPDAYAAQWQQDIEGIVGVLTVFYEQQGIVLRTSFINELPSGSDPDDCRINVLPNNVKFDEFYIVEPGNSQRILDNAKTTLRHGKFATVRPWTGYGLLPMEPCDSKMN
jgi:hypothetical protein